MESPALRTALRAGTATVLSIMASLGILLVVLRLTDGVLDDRALIVTILFPMLVAAPVSAIEFWQTERLRTANCLAASMNEQLEVLHSALADAHMTLAAKARQDGLTGLLNREGFFTEVDSCAAGGALLMIDVDHFKQVNDSFGHLNGDTVLREIAAVLQRTIGARGIVGRIGGEEFAVFMPDGDVTTAKRTGESLRRTVAGLVAHADDGRIMSLSVSIGGADHRAGRDIFRTLSTADECLYAAKTGGRNRVVMRKPHAAAA